MTAKEKSKELIQKYFDLFSNLGYYASLSEGKKCALIAVEEILNNSVMNYSGSDFSNNEILSDTDYWQEVKKEINGL